jgi:hypothetical protein
MTEAKKEEKIPDQIRLDDQNWHKTLPLNSK